MPDPDLTVLRTFVNMVEAHLAKSALEAAGIMAVIRSDDCGGMRPHMQLGGVDLLVRSENAEEASALLDAVQDGLGFDPE